MEAPFGKHGERLIYWEISETEEGGLEKDINMVLETVISLHGGPFGKHGERLIYWEHSETEEGGLGNDVKMVLEKGDSLH